MKFVFLFYFYRLNNEKFFFLKITYQFSYEFLCQLDDIVVFHSLDNNQLSSIIQLKIISLEERFEEKNIKISLTSKALESILNRVYHSGIL